jgi:hypothetical protein
MPTERHLIVSTAAGLKYGIPSGFGQTRVLYTEASTASTNWSVVAVPPRSRVRTLPRV